MKHRNLILFILVIWFVISFVTNILGPIMPLVIDTYDLSLSMAAMLPFSFFLAYGLFSIPAGAMIEKLGAKKSLLIAFSLNLVGALSFALFPFYLTALTALFILGIGMATLQVIINPLMRAAGGEENFAFYAVMAQLVFGLASFLSPFVFSRMMSAFESPDTNTIKTIFAPLVESEVNWSALYWIFATTFVIMLILVRLFRFPKLAIAESEKTGTTEIYLELLRNRQVWMFFFGIVAYVGTEQALANWMSEFLKTYHGLDPELRGAQAVAWFWGSMTIGCVVGLIVLKLFDARWVLGIEVLITMVVLSVALYGPANWSALAFSGLGFCISLMFSIIFSTALNSVLSHPGAFSGILCTGIFGGALLPLIVGVIGDLTNLRFALAVVFIALIYIGIIALKSRPVIENKRI